MTEQFDAVLAELKFILGDKLMDRLAAAHAAEVEAAERDARRLDWLDAHGEAYGFENMHEGNRWLLEGPYTTSRAAIDACMGEKADES